VRPGGRYNKGAGRENKKPLKIHTYNKESWRKFCAVASRFFYAEVMPAFLGLGEMHLTDLLEK
jgi:hypothetical protein